MRGSAGTCRWALPLVAGCCIEALILDAFMNVFLLGQSKVSYFVESLVNQDVRRFQISVDDVVFLEVLKTLANLPKHIQDFPFLLLLFLLVIAIQQIPEIASSAKLSDDIKEAVVLG